MKIPHITNKLSSIFVGCLLILTGAIIAGPVQKKATVRMSVMYIKMMNDQSYLQIQAKAKGEKGFQPVANLKLTIYQVFGDSTVLLGETKTEVDGSVKFILQELVLNPSDTSGLFKYLITYIETDKYKAGEKNIDFYDVDLMAEIITKDSINYVSAHLTEPGSDMPVAGVRLKVNIKRLFQPLQVGKSSYKTEENGTILVPVEEDIPGIDGILDFEVLINESDDYGTVIASFEAPIGVRIVPTDTFDQRTMWSPASKTPYSLLVVPNILLLGIWLTLFILIFNLYRISKSKFY